MLRTVLAVVVGYAAWTVLWLGGNAVLFDTVSTVVAKGERFDQIGSLLGVVALSVVCAIVAGISAASIARERASVAVLATAALLLVTGIGVQSGVWHLLPVWYHLVFLGLIVPVCVVAGRLGLQLSGKRS